MSRDDFFQRKRTQRGSRKHDERTVIPNSYLIVSEGAKTEKNYFDGLAAYIRDHFGGGIDVVAPQIETQGLGRGTVSLVNETARIVNRSPKMYEHVWVVFDKDDFGDFDQAVALAQEKHFQVAWSNQCFEYWLFLHFAFCQSALHRDEWQDKLDKLFTDRSIRKEGYDKALPDIFALTAQGRGLRTALSCAKRQMDAFPPGTPPSQCDPGTTVYRLIEELSEFLPGLL